VAEAKKTTKKSTRKTQAAAMEGDGIHPIVDTRAVQEDDGRMANGDSSALHNHNMGLSAEAEQGVVKILCTLLADEFMLYTKLRKYHWNVTGPEFFSLHEVFEKQYTEVAEYVDVVAERIRSYGAIAPGTLEEFKQWARLSEQPGVNPDAHQMVMDIVNDHEALVRALREDIETIDDAYDDVGAEDLLTGMLQDHQKHAWMMRSLLQGRPV
jgi:starvation-inducible DNA-binding protein